MNLGYVARELQRWMVPVVDDLRDASDMRSGYLIKIGVSTSSFLLTLLALEIGLRLYGYNPFRDWQSGREFIADLLSEYIVRHLQGAAAGQ